jgi:hypothetical protein
MSYEILKADIQKDRQAILDFWNSHNDKPLDEKFDWFYQSNPDGPATTYLVKHSDTPGYVGIASVFPRKFQFKEESFTAGIQGDFFIQSNHRSFGPALMLIRAIVNSLEDSDLDFLYCFPNRKAEPIFRRAGYEYLGATKKYTRLFDIRRLLAEKTPIPDNLASAISPIANLLVNFKYPDMWTFNFGRFETGITNKLDFDIDHLSTQYHKSWFSSHKTRSYLEWKYEQDPDDDNKFFYLKDNSGRVVGCIVYCHEENNLVHIREILHTEDQYTLSSLIGLFYKKIRQSNCEYVYAQIYENSGILRTTNNLDLTVSDQGRKIYFSANTNKESHRRITHLLRSSHFCLSSSDEDT